jgi:hypothetical protein
MFTHQARGAEAFFFGCILISVKQSLSARGTFGGEKGITGCGTDLNSEDWQALESMEIGLQGCWNWCKIL